MKSARRRVVLGGLVVGVGLWLVRDPLQEWVRERATLANDAPSLEGVREMIVTSSDPRRALLRAWHSGGIVHRQVAIAALREVVPGRAPWPPDLAGVVVEGALDADLNVREIALGLLGEHRHPAGAALAVEQLRDADPQVRALGLKSLRREPAAVGLPLVAGLLDDPDPGVRAQAVKAVEAWAGIDFGVKLADAWASAGGESGVGDSALAAARLREGTARARDWWSGQRGLYPVPMLEFPAVAVTGRRGLRAAEFALPDLRGERVRLSDFPGRVVFLHFWATWCTSCLAEVPVLNELQRRQEDRVVILGISLDGALHDHANDEDHGSGPEQRPRADDRPEAVGERVARTVKEQGIAYRVLLDERQAVGGRFNGGELPTTVILDARGLVHRRFVGGRSVAVLEAMVAEAGRP